MGRNALEQAIKMDPALPAAHEGLAYCLFRMQEYDGAEASYREALAYDPRLPSAHAGLGSILMLRYLRDTAKPQVREQALECWHRALELDPDQPKIRSLVEKYRVPAVNPETVLLGRSSQE
jgi:tetratricopeptide (TPR) repeat protein